MFFSKFPTAIIRIEVDYNIKISCEKPFPLEAIFVAGHDVDDGMVEHPRLTGIKKIQHLFDLEGGLQILNNISLSRYAAYVFYRGYRKSPYSIRHTCISLPP